MSKVALLTLISNAATDYGPGHSALAFRNVVWSFEGSGWRKVKPAQYVAENAWRPMIVQEMNHRVPGSKALKYVEKTRFNKYFFSGVCSSLCSETLSYAAYGTLNDLNATFGFDFPDDLAKLVKRRGLVGSNYYIPAERESAKMKERRVEDFAYLRPRKTPGFLSW